MNAHHWRPDYDADDLLTSDECCCDCGERLRRGSVACRIVGYEDIEGETPMDRIAAIIELVCIDCFLANPWEWYKGGKGRGIVE